MLGEMEWQGLQAALEQMLVDYKKFYELCRKQKHALIQHQVDELQIIINDLENCADSIYLMDSRRRMHMELLADMRGQDVLRLVDLIQLWPEMDAAPFTALLHDLQSIRKEIESISKVNAALIHSSRQMLHATVEAVVMAPGEKTKIQATRTYGADGQLRKSRTQPPRNLINRRG